MDLSFLSSANFWMVWRWHDISYINVYYFFLFRFNCTEEHLDENNFRHCYGNFFENTVLECTWSQLCSTFWNVLDHSYIQRSERYLITAMFNVLSQQLRGTLTTAFERQFTAEDFMEMDKQNANSFWTKIDKSGWKIFSCTKV